MNEEEEHGTKQKSGGGDPLAPWDGTRKDGGGPAAPDIEKPDTKSLLERMRRVGRKP